MGACIESVDDWIADNEAPHLWLRAFNLWTGATFLHGDWVPEINADRFEVTFWVIESIERYDTEQVVAYAYCCAAEDRVGDHKLFLFDFNDTVAVVGNIVNIGDPDDNDWGS